MILRILSICLILCASIQAQSFNFKRYSIEEELPRAGVYSLYEDRKGFLWIGTERGGVCVFDGERFKTYTTEDGLALNIVRVVFEDEQGDLWFGTQGKGVSRFDGRTFTNYDTSSGLASNDIRSIAQDDRGNIWLGTFGAGLCRLDLAADTGEVTAFHNFTTADGLGHNRIRALLKDSRGNLWLGTDGGASLFNGQTFNNFTTAEGLPHDRILTIFEDGVKNVWLGTSEGAVRFDGKNFTTYTTEDGLIHNRIRAIAQDNFGSMWFGTRAGISKFDGNTFRSFTQDEGLSNNRIRSIILDSLGNLWIGTYFGGINKYSGEDFVHYTENDGIVNNQILSLNSDREGNIWLGTFEGVSRLSFEAGLLGEVFNITEAEGLANSVVRTLFRDKTGNLWFGTEGGISLYEDQGRGRIRNISMSQGLGGNEIYAIFQEDDNVFWVGTENGVSIISFNNRAFTSFDIKNYSIQDGLASSAVAAIYQDNTEDIWLGFQDNGISLYDGNRFVSPDAGELSTSRISSIIGDSRGKVWIATEGKGIFAYENTGMEISASSFKQYTMEQGLTSNNIYLIIFDNEGNLWVGSEKGIDKVNSDFTGWKHFGREEGFTGIETNAKAVYKDETGKIWFGTIKGAACYDPFASQINKTEAYTHLTGVHIYSGGVELDPSPYAKSMSDWFNLPQDLILPHNKNNLSFDFIGISLKIPSKVEYTWKLEGFEEEWSLPSSKHDVSYTNLSPGRYTFLVKASNDDGIWNEEATAFSFRIRGPFWKSLWFGLCCVIAGFGFFILYTKIRERKLIREKRILMEKVEQRTAEINKQKEELAAEKEKSDDLLLNILPQEAADELKLRGKASTKYYGQVSVLFTDFVSFTKVTEKVSHEKLISELDRYFVRFDEIIDNYNIEKIKTIGDSYMCAGGVQVRDKNHAVNTVLAGLEMQRFMFDANVSKKMKNEITWDIRLGINTGEVIAGVVGKKKFTYDIWGDTVNIASRMESSGEVGKVNISGSTYALVNEYFVCTYRGKISAKNKGHIDMYFVEKIKPEYSINGEGLFPNDDFIERLRS